MESSCFMSLEEVQPINGSISRGCSGSKSSCHSRVLAVPDCIAFLAGLKIRAVMDVRIPWIGDIEVRGGGGRDSIETAFRNLTGDSEAWMLCCPDRYSHYAAL